MVLSDTSGEPDAWVALQNEIDSELEKSRRELSEINLMLEHSQLEVSKLAQRNASATAHLQQVHSQFDRLPRADIRNAYDTALDAQQRLFVMRGQLEKLQSDQSHQEQYVEILEKVYQLFAGKSPGEQHFRASESTVERVEMMIQAQEAERQRLSRQMHDGPAQALSNFILQTEIAMRLFDVDQIKAKDELANLKGSATSTFQKVRDFIFELRPMMLDDLGLTPTIKRYIEAAKNQTNMDVRLTVTGLERRLEPYLEVMVFRAIQEFLKNAISHSQATQINLHVDMGEANVKVICEDNGKGFDIETLADRSYMGLKVLRERAEMLGGYLEVDSVIGQGTRVTYQVPATETSVIT